MRHSLLHQSMAAVFGLAVLVILAGFGMLTASDYHQTLRLAERLSQATARLLEEHAKRSFDVADLALDGFVTAARRGGTASLTGYRWYETAARMRDRLPEDGSIWVIGTDGRALLSSEAHPPPPLDVSDRPYFREHRAGAELLVGEMVHGRNSGRLTFTVSRRISDAGGGFAGIVLAPIGTSYFERFWNGLDLGPNSVLGLLREDGAPVVLRTPRGWGAGGAPDLVAAPADGWVFSRLPVRGYPVVAVAGIAYADVLERFWERFRRNLAVCVAALAGVGLLGVRVFGLVRRETAARHELHLALDHSLTAEAEARRANALAQAARRDAERADRAKSRFLAAASHDLRQPMQSLFLFSALLANQLAGHRAARTVQQIDVALAALRLLLDSLLDISRLEAGAVKPTPRAFPVADVFRQMRVEYGLRAGEKGLRMSVVDSSAVVRSDPALLGQMVRNLIENALRYTDRGGILLGCRRDGGALSIWVADTGCGIADESLEEIFEEFHQLGNPERDRAQGLGLGLSIVRRLSHLLDHPVSVSSLPGRGSCFRIRVPMAAEQADGEAPVAGASA